MPQVKILIDYKPIEGWQVGDIVDITDPTVLIEQEKVALVDDDGNVLERPGAINCPMSGCQYKATTAHDLAQHILVVHPKPKSIIVPVPTKTLVKATTTQAVAVPTKAELTKEQKIRQQRISSLEKARAVRMQNKAKRQKEILKKLKKT